MQTTKNNQENIGAGTQNIAVPPRSLQNKNAKIFSERYVKMRGQIYHLRVFYDGSCEFVRYDEQAKKWVFLCFPPDKIAE